jgi:hypothetical protein
LKPSRCENFPNPHQSTTIISHFVHINMATTTHQSKEAPDFAHVNSVLEDEKPAQVEERDWTGTAKKTDPEEIRLVKKLDLWIMVRWTTTPMLGFLC